MAKTAKLRRRPHKWASPPDSWNSASVRGLRAGRQAPEDLQGVRRPLTDEQASVQGARCMDCGIPFCNNGCPVNNIIPDWNDLVSGRLARGDRGAALHQQLPEFTGRICPAPCEAACTLNINADRWASSRSSTPSSTRPGKGLGQPQPAEVKTGKKVAVVGSGPAGRPPNSSRGPATTSPCSRRTTASAACCATASPTSRWRSR